MFVSSGNNYYLFFFFFQAEDGIRDFCLSRGLGDVYKRQLKYGMPDLRAFFDADLRWLKHYGFVPFDVPGLSGGLSNKAWAGK